MTTSEQHLSATVDGPPVTRRWRLVAEEHDGRPIGDNLGSITLELERRFSMRADADAYARFLAGRGLEVSGPMPSACRYHGPTDSPSNAWAVRGERANLSAGAAAQLELGLAALPLEPELDGRRAALDEAIADGRLDAALEQLVDRRVQRRLATDRAYLHAADADEQAAREDAIAAQEWARATGGAHDPATIGGAS